LTEQICYEVYHNYDTIVAGRETIKKDLIDNLGQLDQVHLQSGRVKKKDSLIEKIIRKRYEYIGSRTSGYAHINGNNYADIITDLVGIRLIVNYRGKWQEIHKQILKDFPLKDLSLYEGVEHLPHVEGENFLAEIPTVYHAKGDSIDQYLAQNLKVKEHTQGYRGIHYVISYKGCYVELQVRTIYDEAWSDCDHNYVYKHEAQPNNRALKKLSHILCKITNVANDIGDNMHDAYNDKRFSDADGDVWKASETDIQFMKDMLTKLKDAENELEEFTKKLKIG
jgi:ppGpp synthetase/RelA/SpoT-type nucleotidyltranferase